jgi:apolipoprotein D and lipocalin family protein
MLLRKASVILMIALSGCASHPPMKTVDYVDLPRFMGDWYVIANIPTFIEKNAHNAIEDYRLNEDGSVATTFTFFEAGFDGKPKRYTPTGFVLDKQTNAHWGMQFIWPFKGDFRIVYLDEGYENTIIARQARDYVWIMSRNPEISDTDYQRLSDVVKSLGYDISQLKRVPQRWDPRSSFKSPQVSGRQGINWGESAFYMGVNEHLELIYNAVSCQLRVLKTASKQKGESS